MNPNVTICLLAATLPLHSPAQETTSLPSSDLPARIAFGSCAHQDQPQPVLNTIQEQQPDLFIYLGDNIYGDTRDMDVLRHKYDQLGAIPGFQALRKQVPLLSVWDDHDYGENDAGKEYPDKEESKTIFMDFWQVPADSPRRGRPGIYGAHRFESEGRVLQVILLDTRTFRDPLKRNPNPLPEGTPFKNDYQPDPDPGKSLLGEAQWQWLEEQLRQPATLRIICSSIQFGHQYNGWESWTNLPVERQRMVDLIQRTQANGVIFISGDVHWGEISRREVEGGYPLYDVTSSGLNRDWPTIEPNRFRVGDPVREHHFGLIDIAWHEEDPEITLQIVDVPGAVRTRHRIRASDLVTRTPDQPSPEAMAAELGIELPRRPWHLADIWWNFHKPIEHFESLSIDIAIDRDIPSTYNLYIAPIGVANINGLQFYGGLQSNINGWETKESRTRVHPGKGAIFSRWSNDKKTPIGLAHVRTAADGLCESAGYEGEFCSVRRPFAWSKGTYTYSIVKGDTETIEDAPHTWFHCLVRSHETGMTTYIGSLRFEGMDFTYWNRHAAFVEVYSTAKIPRAGIPKVTVTFGYPRLNGAAPPLKDASAHYNPTGSPACATARAQDESVVVEVGGLILRGEEEGHHALELTIQP